MKKPLRFNSQQYARRMWEFVYLDAVGTQSLAATLNGSIVEKTVRKNTDTASAGARITTLVPGSQAESMIGVTSARETEIHERAVVESLFASLLRDLRANGFLATSLGGKPPRTTGRASAHRRLRRALRKRHAVALTELQRGTPFEVEMELVPPRIYLAASALESTIVMARHVARLAGDEKGESLDPGQLQALASALSWFHSGTVPIQGRVTSHIIVEEGPDKPAHVVPTSLGSVLTKPGSGFTGREILFAGFCDEKSFWQEPRRILRRKAPFKALIRLEDAKPTTDWSEAEHIDDLHALSPDLADGAQHAYDSARANLGQRHVATPPLRFRDILVRYNDILNQELGHTVAAAAIVGPVNNVLAAHPPADVEPAVQLELLRAVEAQHGLLANDPTHEVDRRRQQILEPVPTAPTAVGGGETGEPSRQELWRVRYLGIYW